MMNHLRNRIKIAFCFYMMVLIIIFCPNLFAANHALLIGIQNYPDTEKFRKRGFQQLSGPRNDIKQMKKILLAQPFEFSKDNIKILLDKDATHTAIEKAFADLSNRIKPNDFVYIHFSGHGSQHENKNPKDDKEVTTSIQGRWTTNDQTWVTYGASSGLYPEMDKDDRDILDDEINVWLAEIGKITNRIVFVSDSCHSGSVSRGPKMGVRAIGMDTRPYPKEILAPNGSPKGIRIGASMDNESAVETIQGGQSYGRFTWFWSQALNDFGPGETWGNIFQRTKTLMREEDIAGRTRVFHEPQIMFPNGDEDLKVLEGNFEKRGTRISVTVVDEKKQIVHLDTGLLSGITKDSIYRIFSGSQKVSESLPEVQIISTEPFSSEAKILKGSIKAGDILVESQHAYNFKPIRIAIEGDSTLRQIQKQNATDLITKKLNSSGLFELVNGREEEGWIVYLLQPDKKQDGEYNYAPNTTLPISNPDAPMEAWVLNMQEELLDDTMRVSLTNLAEGVETLTRKMKILADLLDLKMIKNPPPSGIVVKAHQLIEDATCTYDTNNCFISEKGKYKPTDSTELQQMDRQKLTVGSKIGFSVENKSHEAYYVYLLNITARDGAFVAFPSKRESIEYALIKGKETRILEGVFNFRTPGHEILKVILSLKPLDPRAFEFEGTEERKREITKGPQSPLERLLNRSVRRSERDFEHAPQPSEWGTIQAQMEVVKE